jgi:DNA-binding beta-propeller fold protein YncE
MQPRVIVAIAALALGLLGTFPDRALAELLLCGGSSVVRYDGVSITPFASDPDPGGSLDSPNKMSGATAMAFDPAGNLLVLNEFSKNVLKFNGTTGAYIGPLISTAALASGSITDPNDMEIGTDGNLYIMSHFNEGGKNITRFNATTGALVGVFSASGTEHHQHGLAFGTAGDLFQANLFDHLIERFNGGTGASMGTFASNPGIGTGDLAFGPTTLYVANTAAGGVLRFNALTGTGMPPLIAAAPGETYWGILVDGGTLYLSNTFTGVLRKYDATTGAFISDASVGAGALDIIAMVPEPSASLALCALGACAISARRRRG